MSRNELSTHYDAGGIEVTDFIEAKLTKEQLIGAHLYNIIKYAGRLNFKHSDKLPDALKIEDHAAELVNLLRE